MAVIAIAAAVGAGLSLLGKMASPTTKVDGPRLDDTSIPKSEYGRGIPFIFGEQTINCNLMWGIPFRETTEQSTTGSKGNEVTTTYYYYYGTFAFLVGETDSEPIQLRRVYLSGKPIYNISSGTAGGGVGSVNWSQYFRYYDGTQTTADPTIANIEGGTNTPAYKGKAYIVFDNLPLELFGNRVPEVKVEVVRKTKPTLAEVVKTICLKAGFLESEIDVSQLDGNITGFQLPQNGETYREYIETLGQVYFFYGYHDDQKLYFRHYQRPNAIVDIGINDVGTHSEGESIPPDYEKRKKFGMELPSTIKLGYKNIYANYETDAQYAIRTTSDQNLEDIVYNTQSIDTTLSLTRSEAYSLAYRYLHQIWSSRIEFRNIKLPPSWLNALTPGEVIRIPTASGALLSVQITDIEIGANLIVTIGTQIYNGNSLFETVSRTPIEQNEVVRTFAQGSGSDEPFAPNALGPGTVQVLDIPRFTDDTGLGVYLGVTSLDENYTGADIQYSSDGVNYSNLATTFEQGRIGETTSTLSRCVNPWVVDKANTVTIEMSNQLPLYSLTDEDFHNFTQLFLIGEEIISAKNVTLVAPNTYELSHLLRGMFGTDDQAFGVDKPIGTFVAVLSDSSWVFSRNLLDRFQYYYAKAITGYDNIEDVPSTYFYTEIKSGIQYSFYHVKLVNFYSQQIGRFSWRQRVRGLGFLKDGDDVYDEAAPMPIFMAGQIAAPMLDQVGNPINIKTFTLNRLTIADANEYNFDLQRLWNIRASGINVPLNSNDLAYTEYLLSQLVSSPYLQDENGNDILDQNSDNIQNQFIYSFSIAVNFRKVSISGGSNYIGQLNFLNTTWSNL